MNSPWQYTGNITQRTNLHQISSISIAFRRCGFPSHASEQRPKDRQKGLALIHATASKSQFPSPLNSGESKRPDFSSNEFFPQMNAVISRSILCIIPLLQDSGIFSKRSPRFEDHFTALRGGCEVYS
jgi:hypothetical protein